MKKIIKALFRHMGYTLDRYIESADNQVMFLKMLQTFDINVVFDIGANIGQFGSLLRQLGYDGKIVSFEPLSTAHKKLTSLHSNDPLWHIAPQMAIGNIDGTIDINISNRPTSSSILNVMEEHVAAASDSFTVGSETVEIHKLDTVSEKYIAKGDRIFLKVDTQGYEYEVLLGASNLLDSITGVQLELSLTPLYTTQILYDEIILKMKTLGFELWSISNVFRNTKTGRLLQVDAIFFRKTANSN
jgi:FkbM family methyltransferase